MSDDPGERCRIISVEGSTIYGGGTLHDIPASIPHIDKWGTETEVNGELFIVLDDGNVLRADECWRTHEDYDGTYPPGTRMADGTIAK